MRPAIPRMRQVSLKRVAGYVVWGAVVSVVVAAAAAWFGSARIGTATAHIQIEEDTSGNSHVYVRSWYEVWGYAQECNFLGWIYQSSAIGSGAAQISLLAVMESRFPDQDPQTVADLLGAFFVGLQTGSYPQPQKADDLLTTVKAGWPFRAVSCDLLGVFGLYGGQASAGPQLRDGWSWPQGQPPSSTSHIIPYRPEPAGLFLDSLFWGGVTALAIEGWRWMRRGQRRRRGLCTGCGYDLRGSAGGGVCPECGASATHSA